MCVYVDVSSGSRIIFIVLIYMSYIVDKRNTLVDTITWVDTRVTLVDMWGDALLMRHLPIWVTSIRLIYSS